MTTTTAPRKSKLPFPTISSVPALHAPPPPQGGPINSTMITQVWYITPALAKEWMQKNTSNRPFRQAICDKYIGIIKRGEMLPTHQGICFSWNNIILDGQHRLQAIIDSGVAVSCSVTFGADPATFALIDSGFKRTISDATGIRREFMDPLVRLTQFRQKRVASPSEMQPYIDTFLSASEVLRARCASMQKYLTSASVRASAVLRLVAFPGQQEHVLSMYHAMASANYTEFTPIMTAFARAMQNEPRMLLDEVMIRAWRAFDPANTKITKIQIRDLEHERAILRDIIDDCLTRP